MIKIHYVCRGNVYRSRMAEAYTKSLNPSNKYEVSSSGIQAKLALNGDVDLVAVAELKKDGISNLLSPKWKQTSQSDIDNADIVVILSKSLRKDMELKYKLDDTKTVVWDVPDIDGVYENIKINVNEMLSRI